ncbi:HNH endonuclease family protein [Vibrio parahaemolyticus]|nr:HNH endonuclease family protein [Vibrio parahaemolyticus]MDN4723027.1 HNH endonuclease family protein [Vibrio parahaemolyticus]MDN4726768.1 HNH endonuclease family protein [Vibrio parahaemolyticus]
MDENSRVLVYSVQDTAEATLIFETTNDRGKGLTNLEKIKSFLMYKSYISSEETPEDLLNSIRSRFSDIYKEYEKYESKIAEDSILQYHFIAHQKWNAKEYQQYVSKVKSKINKFIVNKKNDKALHFIDKYSVELKESFLTVHDILKSKIPELRDIFILSRTGNFWPLLIKTYKLDKTENKSNFINIVKLLEKYSFRVYAVNQNRGNTGQSKLYSFARDFDGDYQELENKLKAIIRSYSSNKIFVSNMSDEWIYDWMTTRDLSYFFWKYENYLRTTKQPKSSPMSEEEFITKDSKFKLSIEHIASQTPNKSIVKDSSILPEVDEEFEEEFLHCLGNLTIDPQSSNSSKGNKIFEDKNEKYFIRAPFKTQNELDSFVINNEWSRESIALRKQKLIDFALSNWNID